MVAGLAMGDAMVIPPTFSQGGDGRLRSPSGGPP